MNQRVLHSVHGYAGDAAQIEILMPVLEHHGFPIIIVSPDDSPIPSIRGHIPRSAGRRAYIGQLSWDRQWAQMKMLLEYPGFDWHLMNDSDSFCLNPKLPNYLFEDENALWSNLVEDFRKPGERYTDASGSIVWPADYHQGFPLMAAQPPYFCHRSVLEKLVKFGPGQACPTTPFIDWQMVYLPTLAKVKQHRFRKCASCETVTPLGKAVMTQQIVERGAEFIHAVKTQESLNICLEAYKNRKPNAL